jgi:hypothetical protein
MNVPVLPLAVGNLPGGMAEEIQAIVVSPRMNDLSRTLQLEHIRSVITFAANASRAVFESAEFHDDRTRMLKDTAGELLDGFGACRIRQKGALSSFSLPDASHTDPIWDSCEGHLKRTNAVRRDQRSERMLLERHARGAGCDLIIDPTIDFSQRGDRAKAHRVRVLREFLQSVFDNSRIRVVFADAPTAGNLLLIGDWFMAESITPAPGQGYLQTLGTWHAPTILRRLLEFDVEFARLCESQDCSTRAAYRRLAKHTR